MKCYECQESSSSISELSNFEDNDVEIDWQREWTCLKSKDKHNKLVSFYEVAKNINKWLFSDTFQLLFVKGNFQHTHQQKIGEE